MTFIVTLESDAVISETSATAGVHSTLDYLPGAALLGACAASLYDSLAPEESFLVFHSGRVRFGNAYPLAENGAPAIPVPAAMPQPQKAESLPEYSLIYMQIR